MISVVVCTYNQASTIGRALDSILRQRCPWPVEIVVGDDHSTDSTLSICRDYERKYGERVRVIAHKRNLGVLGNYVECLMSCHGKYIADLAGDDEWADDGKLAMQLEYMESHPDTAIVHTDYILRDATTGLLTLPPRYHLQREPYGGEDFVRDMMSRDVRPPVHLCTAMYRMSLFRECMKEWPQYFVGGRYPCEDIQITALMAMRGKVAYIDKVTLFYTIGGESVSHNNGRRRHCQLIKGCIDLSADIARTLNITAPEVWGHLGRISDVMLCDAMASGDRTLRDDCLDIISRHGLSIGWRGKAAKAIMRMPGLWRWMQDALSWAGDNSRRNQPKERLQDWEAGNGSDNMTEGFSERGSDTDGTGMRKPRKKILFVIEGLSLRGGLERVMADRMNALAGRGHEIVMVEVYDHGDSPDAFYISPEVRRIRLGIRKRGLWMKPWQFHEVMRATRRVVDEEKPDAMTAAALLGVMVYGMSAYRTRMIYESHGARRFMPLKLMVRRMERRVDTVVTLTRADAMEYAIARHKVVIPNYSDISSVSSGTSGPSGSSRLSGLSGSSGNPGASSQTIISLGRLTPQKDFAMLLRAWHIVSKAVPTANLAIYGDGPERNMLERLAVRLGISGSVSLNHSVSDVEAVYRRASLLVMSSRFEGFGMVILEAMQRGVAVVSVDAPHGPRDLLGGGGGILTERSAQALADAIIRLLTDPDLTQRIGHDATKAAERYDKDRIISMWENVMAGNA
ncbi:MAG: glycosyltransferase [bacterium]|nr:glycosyltransferase [bacterium]